MSLKIFVQVIFMQRTLIKVWFKMQTNISLTWKNSFQSIIFVFVLLEESFFLLKTKPSNI
jgi:hypothetical protein